MAQITILTTCFGTLFHQNSSATVDILDIISARVYIIGKSRRDFRDDITQKRTSQS